ncbi:Ctsh [Symbiodinium sp. KB8]|nr:Ctsh [Symbiodinium sp. KB8]
MMRRCLLAAALMHQAAAELLCERTGACTRDREEENSILLHTRLYKANVSKHVMKMMNFERPPQDYTFDQYVKDFGKKYDPKSGEYAEREQAFKEALSAVPWVQAHNADASKTYKVAINVYSDWTAEELKSLRGLKKMKREASAFKVKSLHLSKDEEYPQKVDWRESSPTVVTPPKNQGHCGSCWAFATTGVVESHAAIHSGVLTVLSPQQMVSCAENPEHCGGTGGCDGSTSELAMDYIIQHGLTYEEVIPYESFFGAHVECSREMELRAAMYKMVTITGWVKTETNLLSDVMHAIVNYGPLAISVDASGWSPYSSGIANPCDITGNVDIDARPLKDDHAVGLVGYGEEDGKMYWTVRNSWGATWGENGYIRLERQNDQNYCGMDNTPHHGSACENEPDTPVKVCGTCGILYDVSYPTGARVVGVGSGDVDR